MLIYRSVGASAIATIMAAHRQPARNRRDNGVGPRSIETEINSHATGLPDSQTFRPGPAEEDAQSTPTPPGRGGRQSRP
jgi:hypothetical protein